MKYLPTDVSTFSTMITGNYVYVDKTKYIYDLFRGGNRYYFLSRPRRFGKSLLISTLKELFLGNRQLFEGLWISKSDFVWEKHPVIHLDFSKISHRDPRSLEESLNNHLEKIALHYNITLTGKLLEDRTDSLIKKLSEINKVVILIDKYDQPILKHVNNITMAEANREILKSFYETIKGSDQYLRAIFITGVAQFSKTSIFSGINNLNDISLDKESAQLLGYTEQEIKDNFAPFIKEIASQENRSIDTVLENMRHWYNGYRFSARDLKVYNPFSILYYLGKHELRNYWFESGTPTFLITLLKKQYYNLEDLNLREISRESLGTFEIENISLLTLLFQTGYLTIVDYSQQSRKFRLGYPNEEIKESFNKYLIATLTHNRTPDVENAISLMVNALRKNNVDLFCQLLQSLMANIPYNLHIDQERYFHSLFQFLGNLIGLAIQSEIITDKGRIDLVITTEKEIFIFELKFNDSAESALQQIEDRKYYERFMINRKNMMLVGLAFNYVKEKLELSWKTKRIDKIA